jgi:hypothetical protein
METKKTTLSTIKSFVKKNEGNLWINVTSDFDGMTDCVEAVKDGWQKVTKDNTQSKDSSYHEATMGVSGAWFVRGGRDYFNQYNEDGFTGYRIFNSCGSFVLAIKSN